MKKFKFIILVMCMMIMICTLTSKAEGQDIIDIKIKEEYIPIDGDIRPVTNELEDVSLEDKETLSRLLWSSPLSDETEKVKLLWVVFNRINSRASAFSGMTDISSAVNNHEFPWFDRHAHLSDENDRIVRETMLNYNDWYNGTDIEHPSAQAVYCAFYGASNEHVSLYDYKWFCLD